MEEIQYDKNLGCEILHMLKFDADLVSLEVVESQPIDRLHHEVDVLIALESGVEFWEASSCEGLLSLVLETRQDISFVEQMLDLLLLGQLL